MSGRKADNLLEEKIRKFLTLSSGDGDGFGFGDGVGSGSGEGYGYGYGSGSGEGYGYGYGSGSGEGYGYGYGSGDGSGDGDGFGNGYGYGYGSGDGSGDGDGDGSGVKTFNGRTVHLIDELPTIIESVHNMYAKGSLLNKDLTLTPIFVARVGNCFAHGATLRQAQNDARAKDMERRPIGERIDAFVKAHPDADERVSGKDLYEWHHVLTGSCKAGRDAWCRDRGLNPDRDRMTVRRFIFLTANTYGGSVIHRLAEAYGIDTDNTTIKTRTKPKPKEAGIK